MDHIGSIALGLAALIVWLIGLSWHLWKIEQKLEFMQNNIDVLLARVRNGGGKDRE